jgi:hypothetical protein
MTERRDIRDDLEPGAPDALIRLAERLEAERPVPAPAFRGDLRRHLLARAAPRGLHARIAAFAGSGGALLALAFASAAGAGPFGS